LCGLQAPKKIFGGLCLLGGLLILLLLVLLWIHRKCQERIAYLNAQKVCSEPFFYLYTFLCFSTRASNICVSLFVVQQTQARRVGYSDAVDAIELQPNLTAITYAAQRTTDAARDQMSGGKQKVAAVSGQSDGAVEGEVKGSDEGAAEEEEEGRGAEEGGTEGSRSPSRTPPQHTPPPHARERLRNPSISVSRTDSALQASPPVSALQASFLQAVGSSGPSPTPPWQPQAQAARDSLSSPSPLH
jgi:hypothetical protein